MDLPRGRVGVKVIKTMRQAGISVSPAVRLTVYSGLQIHEHTVNAFEHITELWVGLCVCTFCMILDDTIRHNSFWLSYWQLFRCNFQALSRNMFRTMFELLLTVVAGSHLLRLLEVFGTTQPTCWALRACLRPFQSVQVHLLPHVCVCMDVLGWVCISVLSEF